MRKISLLGWVWVAIACTSENVAPDASKLGYTYFPMEIGNYRVYEVNVVEYFFSGDDVTHNYQLKELVADTFQNLEGGISYRIERFVRPDDTMGWELDSVWSSRINTYQAIMVENNVPILKLVFPFRENKTWDANTLNDKEEDEYEMMNVFKPFPSSDSVAFEKTITVIQEEVSDNILYSEMRKEVYGDSVGLVYKELVNLEYCADVDCLGQFIIESGIEYRQHLIEYGKE